MQTLAMLDIVAAIRRKAGSHPDHVFTMTISPAGLVGFSGMNASYAAAFKPPSSARSIMEISRRLGGIPLEIEGIAPAERKSP
jgi:enamine deaminase RidA (YjgF/YER057c/UK114 family)